MSGGTVRSSHHRTLVNGYQKGHICQMTKRSEIVKTSHFSCPFSAIVGNLRSEEAKWCNLCNVTDELGIFIGRATTTEKDTRIALTTSTVHSAKTTQSSHPSIFLCTQKSMPMVQSLLKLHYQKLGTKSFLKLSWILRSALPPVVYPRANATAANARH